jgi:hypothetical protein
MNRFSRFTFATLVGLGAVVAAAAVAGATTYSFTVPVTVTATKNVTSANVTCAIGGNKLQFQPGQGNVVRGAADTTLPGGAVPSGTANVALHAGGTAGTYTGQATVSVNFTPSAGTTANPTNYICFAVTGTDDAYTTAPVVSGTLPVIVK